LVTLILAISTAGVGAAANVAAKSGKLAKAGKLLKKITETIKRTGNRHQVPKKDLGGGGGTTARTGSVARKGGVPEVESPKIKPDETELREYDTPDKSGGPKNTPETKKPEVKIRNRHLAGKKHPKTDVPFDDDGFPTFESSHDVEIPKELNSPDVTDTAQFKHATNDLKQTLDENPVLKSNFTDEQLKAIEKGNAKIPDYTWHHHQGGKTLQLVDQTLHSKTGHTGGRAVTGGRPR
jgi:hypothetical protein